MLVTAVMLASLGGSALVSAAEEARGVEGDPAAIADARAMVEAMGGIGIWRQLEQVHFVHEWSISSRPDVYLEHEILDLGGPRSYVTMESEIYHRIRAYSPEHRYWNIVDGEFEYASDEAFASAMERAPYSIYRLARAIAREDGGLRIEHGPMPGYPQVTALEFWGDDDEIHGWITLNQRKEPVVWATTQYSYGFGPLERYGSLWVPRWAVTSGGLVRYEMVSLTASREPVDPSLFASPEGVSSRPPGD